MDKVNIYCISGLGADERIFRKLDIPNVQLVHLPWLPFDVHDDLPCYAQKMSSLLPEKNPIILGLSFGGMLATEIALQQNVKHVFLVSSAKGKQELPEMSRLLSYMINHKLVPFKLFSSPNQILYNRFGVNSDDDKHLLNDIMKDTDTHFLGWAFRAIINWRNTTIPSNVTHIHGTADRILPPESITANFWLNEGSHMMVYNRAKEVSALIAQTISHL
ncbi:MAG: alpha/beta hydrolase [Bacteroidetes bacterium]|nr:alpha/beta hydrolase [Bacteroidota bacterium]